MEEVKEMTSNKKSKMVLGVIIVASYYIGVIHQSKKTTENYYKGFMAGIEISKIK